MRRPLVGAPLRRPPAGRSASPAQPPEDRDRAEVSVLGGYVDVAAVTANRDRHGHREPAPLRAAEEPAAAADEAAVPAGRPVAGHRAEHVHLRGDAVDVAAVRTDGHPPDLVERAAADASPAAPSLADAADAARLLAEHSRRPVAPQDRDGVTDRGRRVHAAPVARDGEVYGSGEPASSRAALATATVGDAARRPLRLGQALRSLRQHADGAAP